MIQMIFKQLFPPQKLQKIAQRPAPRPQSMIRLGLTSLLTTSPNLDNFGKIFNFWFKSFPFSKV